jgi:diacylglycerol kinase (ATP)
VGGQPSVGLVVNPSSGRGKGRALGAGAAERLRAMGCDVEAFESRSAIHLSELGAEAAVRHEVVAALGGDGTIALVAQGVVGTAAALAIVPAGTGNDLAANLGYERKDALAACAVIAAGRRRRIDVGRIEGHRMFLCVAGGGFDSETNREANAIRHLRGPAVYLVAVLRTLRRFSPASFTVTLDGTPKEFRGFFVAVGNAASYGGGMRITPDASLDDGLFDICLVGEMSKRALLGQLPRLFTGGHVRHPAVEILRAKRVTIAADRAFTLYADGEEIGPLPATLTVELSALEVIAP